MVAVFIVDDDTFLQRVLKRILSIGGHAVVDSAYNEKEAIEKFIYLDPKPEIILMDYRMPVMNGAEATREIIQLEPSVNIVSISSDDSFKDVAMDASAIDFLVKPIRNPTLFETIKKYSAA